MARRTSPPPEPLPSLLEPRASAREKIQARIAAGHVLLQMNIPYAQDLVDAHNKRAKWSRYNVELLKRLFSTRGIAEEYIRSANPLPVSVYESLGGKVDVFRAGLRKRITMLESIAERLELIPEAPSDEAAQVPAPASVDIGNKVFIVHGHDAAIKEKVARFVEKLKLTPIILHEQPSASRTLIEKIEAYADVRFALVLLTADDVGAPADNRDALSPRARQNVVFELGYFMARLGRPKVCALYQDGVELPSDVDGVTYVLLDPGDGWQLQVAREMRAAGLPVDMNAL